MSRQRLCAQLFRWVLYGAYGLIGVAWAASFPTSNVPVLFESFGGYDRMAHVFAAPSLTGLIDLPWWVAETGTIALFLWAVPFLAAFGPTLFALQLSRVVWNLVGLRLLERSFDDERVGLLAAGLAAFGSALATTTQLSVSGSHQTVLLPLGLLLWLAHAMRSDAARWTPWKSAGVGCAVLTTLVMTPFLGVEALLLFGSTAFALPRDRARRMAVPFAVGAIVTFALLLPVVLHQTVPPSGNPFTPSPRAPQRLAWLVAGDFARYVASPSSRVLGYAVEAALAWAVFVVARTGARQRDVSVLGLLACCLLGPLWILSSPHYQPEDRFSDLIRFRHLALTWSFVAIPLAMGIVASLDAGPWTRRCGRVAAFVAFLAMGHGIVRVCGAIDVGALGITQRMPLASPLGSLLGRIAPKGATSDSLNNVGALPRIAPELRPTLAFYLAEGLLWTPHLNAPLPMAVTTARSLGPDALHDAYLTGLGFFACDGGLRGSAQAMSALPDLARDATASELDLVREGCGFGKDRDAGRVYFDVLDWPLSDHVLRRGRNALWGPLFDRRGIPSGSARRQWPWQ